MVVTDGSRFKYASSLKELELFLITPIRHLGNGGLTPHILKLGCRWRWLLCFTTWLLYLQEERPLLPVE